MVTKINGDEMSKVSKSGFYSQGTVTRQPHVDIPEGLYEEEHARRGFFGRTSHLYHRHPPTGWLRIQGDARPRAFRAMELVGHPEGCAEWLLENNDCRIGISRIDRPMSIFFRNGDGDEVRFVHQGQGRLQTDYGDIHYEKGDYLVIPRGTTFRMIPEATLGATELLVIEAHSEIELPDRGMLGRHAQFDPMILDVPTLPEQESTDGKNQAGEYELWIQREGQITRVTYPFSPCSVAGWKGDLAPWRINIRDIRPIVSPRYHLPPSVHTTFVAQNFVICSFLPRPFESEPGAMKVPFYHRNVDFDEVLFYHDGNFFSREGIQAGNITFHPYGIHHGPHPNAAKNAADKEFAQESAVMIDTRNALRVVPASAVKTEVLDYVDSWRLDRSR